MQGTLLIVVNNDIFYNIGIDDQDKFLEALTKNLENDNWLLADTIFVGIHELYDAMNRTKTSRLFVNKVFKAVEGGSNIIFVVPYINMVSKNLRDKAIIVNLPTNEVRM